ncbi:hypothetical protein IWQ60_010180 [Tieghemiomyces parasiticus]|uniref:Uncharacterized protein n=1 Tax=Tieghemiomyces parasiticus TaxID=78921 RepID=A0A9W7ZS79_9FUNG|nr:hypothetical protein IWQ60_010180 [Tieghemiomyces parasiticus]
MAASDSPKDTGRSPSDVLTAFVKEEPNLDYTVDAKSDLVCRNLPNGQRSCIKVHLDQKEMFSVMQKLDFFCSLPIDPTQTYLECRKI